MGDQERERERERERLMTIRAEGLVERKFHDRKERRVTWERKGMLC